MSGPIPTQGFLGALFNPVSPFSVSPQAHIRANELRKRFGFPPLSEQSSQSELFGKSGVNQLALSQRGVQGGAVNFALAKLLSQLKSSPSLPPLPQIPELTKAPSRLSDRQIAGAARSLRVAASKRKGRASTILGGSIGDEPERKTLLGA